MSKCDGWSCQIIKTYHKDKKFKVRFTKCSDEHDEGNVEIVSMSRVVLDCLYCCRPVRDIKNVIHAEIHGMKNLNMKRMKRTKRKRKVIMRKRLIVLG